MHLIPCNHIANRKKSQVRKRPSNFAFAVYDLVTMINTEHWSTVVKYGSEFLELDYLKVLEKEHPENMHFHYAIIYDANVPVAIAYFQVVDFSSENFGSLMKDEEFTCKLSSYVKRHITNHLLKTADRINMRLLICGNAFISGEHGFAAIPKVDKVQTIDALADVIYRISRAEKLRGKIAAVLAKDFYAPSLEYTKELEEYKYYDFLVEPNMILDIAWGSFEEYLNAISKKYRNRAKSIIKKGLQLDKKEFTSKDILANAKQIQVLYDNVHLKAKFRMATLPVSYFAEMKNELKDRFRFIGYYCNERLIGFRTLFINKKSVEAHFIGLDYQVNKELEVYQNMLYDFLRDSIELKVKKLFFGRTASEMKSTLGAKSHELYCYIRHRNPLSNTIIKPFIELLKPTEWTPRNPFKEE